MGTGAGWWRTHFDLDTLSGYGLERTARAEVEGLLRVTRLRPGARVLDLCCGAGRHAVLLAERGLEVTGVDLMPGLLAAAREAAEARGVAVTFARADARRLRYRRRFDATVILFTSFGYFAEEADDLAVLRGVRRALKPGGALVLDLLNREWLVRHFTPAFSQRGEGRVRKVLNRLAFDLASGRLENRRVLIGTDGSRRETRLDFRVYSLRELRRLLETAGLRLERVWGGLDGRPYGLDSRRMVALAR